MPVDRRDGIRVDGVRELTRALNRAGSVEQKKAMGAANKAIGQEVIARLQPLPQTVGLGAGAKVRPSASSRLVQLRAGGAHREKGPTDPPLATWGKQWRPRRNRRPHIVGTALRVYPNIEKTYLEGIDRALRGAGLEGLT